MENFNQIFTLTFENKVISLNTDILETGVINIIIVIGILFYTGKDFLGSLLKERKTIIIKSVQDAEDGLTEAKNRLREAEKQLNQLYVVISEIENQGLETKKLLLQSDAFEAKKDLKILFKQVRVSVKSAKQQISLDIRKRIIARSFREFVIKTKEYLTDSNRAQDVIQQGLDKIKGKLI
jgi:F-type H+-transporting ATPase subunit b